MAKRIIKYSLWIVILIILIFPVIQNQTSLLPDRYLQGSEAYSEKPAFTWTSWFNGSYQPTYDKFIEDHIGSRSHFVRLNNQLNFSLFKKTYVRDIVVMKDGVIAEKEYIDSYYGTNFIGKQKAIIESLKIKYIQDTLKKRGVIFIPVFAPGKATYYSDKIPDWYMKRNTKSLSNYEYYTKVLDSLNIKYIDFNSYFLSCKDTTRHILFPRYGIHWSDYGVGLVLDSLQNYFSEELQRDDLVVLTRNGITKSTKPRNDDNDIEKGLNLLFDLKSDSLSYCNYEFIESDKFKPKSLVISDSYYWQIFSPGYAKKIFSENNFWFYYYENYSLEGSESLYIDKTGFAEQLTKFDIILTVFTERNLHKMGNGFYNEAYCAFKYSNEIEHNISYLYNDSTQFNIIQKKADEWNMPVDKVIEMDALWLVKESHINGL